jgi:hypothetical protein
MGGSVTKHHHQNFCFCFFSLNSFKTILEDRLLLSLCEGEKESEKKKKNEGRGLKPTLLVSRNIV